MKSIWCLLLITVVTGQVLAQQPDDKAFNDNKPIIRVGHRHYSLKQLYGVNEGELRARYLKNLEGAGDDALWEELKRCAGHRREIVRPATRQQLEAELFQEYLRGLAEYPATLLVMAAITDRILSEHNTRLEDFFDVLFLEDAVNRRAGLYRFIEKHRGQPENKDEALYQEAEGLFQCAMFMEKWKGLLRPPEAFTWPVVTQFDAIDRAKE